jgi:hypothetical protein
MWPFDHDTPQPQPLNPLSSEGAADVVSFHETIRSTFEKEFLYA